MRTVTLRPFRGPEDYAAIAAVRNRQIDVGDEGMHTTVEQVAEYDDHLQRSDPATDIVIAEHGGEVRGLAALGFDEAALGADVDGPTRAIELDERLGYREVKRMACFERRYSTSSHQSL